MLSSTRELLPQTITETIIALFLYRNECAHRDAGRPEHKLFRGIPVFGRSQFARLQDCRQKPVNIRSFFSDVGYQTAYDRALVQRLVDEGFPDRATLLAALCFQAISRLFVSRDLLDADSFDLLMRGISQSTNGSHLFEYLIFYFLLKSAFAGKPFTWGRQQVASVCQSFDGRQNLGPEFYPLLIAFLTKITAHGDRLLAIGIVNRLFEEHRLIVQVDSYEELLSLVRPFVCDFDRGALLVLGHISAGEVTMEIANSVRKVPAAFQSRILRDWSDFSFEAPTEMAPKSGGPLRLNAFPRDCSLGLRELRHQVPDSVILNVRVLAEFVSLLHAAYLPLIIEGISDSLEQCVPPDAFAILSGVLLWLDTFTMSWTVDVFYRNFVRVINPSQSIFGPYTMDPLINVLRGSVVELVVSRNPSRLPSLFDMARSGPPLVAELFGRVLFHARGAVEELATDEMIRFAGDSLAELECGEARAAIILFLSELSGLCIGNPPYIGTFLSVLSGPDLVCFVVKAVARGVASSPNADHESLFAALFAKLTAPDMLNEAIPVLAEMLNACPSVAVCCLPYLELIIRSSRPGSFARLLEIVAVLAAVRQQFSLSFASWKRFARHVTRDDYQMLLNMAGAARTIVPPEFFLIVRPVFLSLVLIAVGPSADDCITLFSGLAEWSSYNRRMLHEGDVDSILLSSLADPKVCYQTMEFEFRAKHELIFVLLVRIAFCGADAGIVRKFLRAMELTHDIGLIACLKNAVCESKADLENQFPIGTLGEFAVVKNLAADDFNRSFTISFWMRADSSMLVGAPLTFDIMKIVDPSGMTLSIVVMNHMLYAVSEGPSARVISLLCNRLVSMVWTQYLIQFDLNPTDGRMPGMMICRDGYRLADCEFAQMKFPGPLVDVRFGGRAGEAPPQEYGRMGYFYMLRRPLTCDEVDALAADIEEFPPDYLISSSDFAQPKSAKSDLPSCCMNETTVRRLVRLWGSCHEPNLLAVVSEVISSSYDTDLPSEFASILLQGQRTFELFLSVEAIVFAVKHRKTQVVWFEDVLINLDLWDLSNVRLIRYWNSILISKFAELFTAKSYFPYFLAAVGENLQHMILFLKRLAFLNFTAKDLEFFVSWIWETDDPQTASFSLEIIRDIAEKVRDLNYPLFENLLGLVGSKLSNVVLLAIECLHAVCGSSFFIRARSIVATIALRTIIPEIELLLGDRPDLFVINCGLSCEYPELKLSVIPDRISPFALWYYFPLLLYIRSSGEVREGLGLFLARNAATCSEFAIDSVIFSLHVFGDFSLLSEVLQVFPKVTKADQISVVLFHAFASLFHRFSAKAEANSDVRFESFEPTLSMRLDVEKMKQDDLFVKAIRLADAFSATAAPPAVDGSPSFTYGEITQQLLDGPFEGSRPLFVWMRAVLAARYAAFCEQTSDAFHEFFGNTPVGPPAPVPLTGRVRGEFNVAKEIRLRREAFLTQFCPFTILRSKTQNSPARLIVGGRPFFPDAELVTFASRTPLRVAAEDKKIVLRTSGRAIQLLFSQIQDMLCLDDRAVQIHRENLPFLIEFPPGKLMLFLRQLATARFLRIHWLLLSNDPMTGIVEALTERWQSRDITSFKFLSLLNLLSGRTFRDVKRYPVFPWIVPDFDSCCDESLPPVEGTYIFDSEPAPAIDFSARLFVLPEWYFFSEICGSPVTISANRRRLENCENLEVWINRVFGQDNFPHRRLFDERIGGRRPFAPRSCELRDISLNVGSNIIFCCLFKSSHSNADFAIVCENGRHFQVRIDLDGDEPMASVTGGSKRLENPASYQFWAIHHRRVIVATRESPIVVLTSTIWLTSPGVCASAYFSECICRSSSTNLARFLFGPHTVKFSPFTSVPEKIVCFASSHRFNVTAIACADAMLRIRSTRTGAKVATVPLDREWPVMLLVTKSMGFIVVRTVESFFVFNPNGMFVAKSRCDMVVRNWTTFRTFDGLDWVAFDDGSGTIWYFEVIEPGKMAAVKSALMNIVALTFDWRWNAFIVVTAGGKVSFHRRG
jgi:hypothetical protein